MSLTPQVKAILANYESDNPGTKANLVRLMNTGVLAGTGKLVILPVDQGFEHGPRALLLPTLPPMIPIIISRWRSKPDSTRLPRRSGCLKRERQPSPGKSRSF